MIVPACAAHDVSMHPDIPRCRMTLTRIAPSLKRAYVNFWQSALSESRLSCQERTYSCIFNTVPQHDGTTVSLLNANARKPSCQSIAVAIKLVVRQLGLLVSGDDAMNL